MQETTLHPGGQFLAWWALPSLGGGFHERTSAGDPQPACCVRPGQGPCCHGHGHALGHACVGVELDFQDPALTTATSSLLGPLVHLNSGPGACQLVINSAQEGTCGSFGGWQVLQPT